MSHMEQAQYIEANIVTWDLGTSGGRGRSYARLSTDLQILFIYELLILSHYMPPACDNRTGCIWIALGLNVLIKQTVG
jgi:hypothetical protein